MGEVKENYALGIKERLSKASSDDERKEIILEVLDNSDIDPSSDLDLKNTLLEYRNLLVELKGS